MDYRTLHTIRTAPLEELSIPSTNRFGIVLAEDKITITNKLLTSTLPWYSCLVKGEVKSVTIPFSFLSCLKTLGAERNEVAGYLLGTLQKGVFKSFGIQQLALGTPDSVALDDFSTVPPHRRIELIVELLLMKAKIPNFAVMLFHSHPNLALSKDYFSESDWRNIHVSYESRIQRGDYDFLRQYYGEIDTIRSFGWESGAELSDTDRSFPTSAQLLLRSSLPVGEPRKRLVCFDTRGEISNPTGFTPEIPITVQRVEENGEDLRKVLEEVRKCEHIADRVSRDLFGNEDDNQTIIRSLAREEIKTKSDIPVASRSQLQIDNLWKIASLWKAATPDTPPNKRTALSVLYGAGITLPCWSEVLPASISIPEVLNAPIAPLRKELSDILQCELPLRINDLKKIWTDNDKVLRREIKEFDTSRICLQGLTSSALEHFSAWCSNASSLPHHNAWPCWAVNRVYRHSTQSNISNRTDYLNVTSLFALSRSNFTYIREPLGAVLVFQTPEDSSRPFYNEEPSRGSGFTILSFDSKRLCRVSSSCHDNVIRVCLPNPYSPRSMYRGIVPGNKVLHSPIDPIALESTNLESWAIKVLLERIFSQRMSASILSLLRESSA
jgi:hypothetical protein